MRFASLVLSLCIGLAFISPSAAHETPSYLRLVDPLDRPNDGYCLDVIGAGGSFRPDMPLVVHNCKPGRAPDGMVAYRKDGSFFFPAFDACVTAMGVNRKALPGSALMLKPCGAEEAFLRAANFQSFQHRLDGRLELATSGLCMTVGNQSAETFSPTHAWRPLFLMPCEQVPEARSRWTLQRLTD